MSGHLIDPVTTRFRGSTAPTPGFRRTTPAPAVPGELDTSPPRQTEVCKPLSGRGGGHRGTQGCPSRIAYTADKSTHSYRSSYHIATNGPAGNLSSQPPRPANLRGTSSLNRTRTTPGEIDRSACKARVGTRTGQPRHGDRSAYDNFGCRCPDAREAKRLWSKRRREGRSAPALISAIGTRRRLQALACLGYSPAKIADGGPCTGMQMETIRSGKTRQITRTVATHVKEFYDDHQDQPLPRITSTTQVRNTAKRCGWAHPRKWTACTIDDPNATPLTYLRAAVRGEGSVNEVVDLELLLSGRAKRFTDHETRDARRYWRRLTIQAVRVLTQRGAALDDIADKLKIDERQVVRYRKIHSGELCRGAEDNGDAPNAGTTPPVNSTPKEASAA